MRLSDRSVIAPPDVLPVPVSTTLARAAARAALRDCLAQQESWGPAGAPPLAAAPRNARALPQWVEQQCARLAPEALAVDWHALGHSAVCIEAYWPQCHATPGAAVPRLGVLRQRLCAAPGVVRSSAPVALPLMLAGHALIRLFQRHRTVCWPLVRAQVASAALWAERLAQAHLQAGCQQAVVPLQHGLLLGQMDQLHLALGTFVPLRMLDPRKRALFYALQRLQAIDAPAPVLGRELGRAAHHWLRQPYQRGSDPDEAAWCWQRGGDRERASNPP